MSRNQFSGKWGLQTAVIVLAVGALTLVAWGGVQVFAMQVPFEADWASSGHADATAEAFVHWNGDNPISATA
jgi:hypothetical protein